MHYAFITFALISTFQIPIYYDTATKQLIVNNQGCRLTTAVVKTILR